MSCDKDNILEIECRFTYKENFTNDRKDYHTKNIYIQFPPMSFNVYKMYHRLVEENGLQSLFKEIDDIVHKKYPGSNIWNFKIHKFVDSIPENIDFKFTDKWIKIIENMYMPWTSVYVSDDEIQEKYKLLISNRGL